MKLINYRTLLHALVCTLALQSISLHAIEDPFKNIGQWITKAASDVGTSITSFAEKTTKDIAQYATLSGPGMVDALRGQVGKLKGQFKEYGGRIITGNLPAKDKVLVFGTIIAIVTLTALVAGVSVISIKNKQQEAIAQKAKEISDKTASGIKGLFLKAKNALDQFDENLKSLGQCLKTGSCTQGQKQFLYGAAITVAALTLLAVGIGVGAFFYKKHKAQQLVDLPGESGDAELDTVEQEIILAPTDQERNSKTQQLLSGLKSKIEFALKPISESSNKISNYFAAIANSDQPGPFANTANYINQQLTLANTAYQKATTAVGPVKTELAMKAKESYKLAKAAAKKFINTISASAGEFIAAGLANILSITPQPIKEIFSNIVEAKNNIVVKLNELKGATAIENIKLAMDKYKDIINKYYLMLGDPITNLKSEMQRIGIQSNKIDTIISNIQWDIAEKKSKKEIIPMIMREISGDIKALPKEEKVVALRERRRITDALDPYLDKTINQPGWLEKAISGYNVLTEIPELFKTINQIEYKPLGITLNAIAGAMAALTNLIASINKLPVIGSSIISDSLNSSLDSLSQNIYGLGNSVADIFTQTPLFTKYPSGLVSLTSSALSVAYVNYGKDIVNDLQKMKDEIINIYYLKVPQAEKLLNEKTALVNQLISSMIMDIKGKFKNEITNNNYLALKNAPKLLAHALGDYIAILKPEINNVFNAATSLLNLYSDLLIRISVSLVRLNTVLKGSIEVNPAIIQALGVTGSKIESINKIISNIRSQAQQIVIPTKKALPGPPPINIPYYDPTPTAQSAPAA